VCDFDAMVIGAGAVGLSVGAELAEKGYSVAVVEQHDRIGAETSSHNSEVVHSGIHYPTGSLKALLCVEGAQLLEEAAGRYGIPFCRTGKITVASTVEETAVLEHLARQGRSNGVTGVEMLTAAQVSRMEPDIRAAAGLFTPTTALTSAHRLMEVLAGRLSDAGGLLGLRHRVAAVEPRDKTLAVTVAGCPAQRFVCRCLVNCAGLSSDAISTMAGIPCRLHWAKGDYFSLHRKIGVSRLIYPIPGKTGIGIHLTPKMGGGFRVGPDVEYVSRRQPPYSTSAGQASYAPDGGKRRLFWQAARRYLPSLAEEELVPEMYGIRPKLQGPDDGFADFAIRSEPHVAEGRFINCLGIESPGLTACLAIGRYVARIAEEVLG